MYDMHVMHVFNVSPNEIRILRNKYSLYLSSVAFATLPRVFR